MYEVPIDPEIVWLATEILWDLLVDWGQPGFAALVKDGVSGEGLALDQETRDWLLESQQHQIAGYEHFIAAATALISGAMGAQLEDVPVAVEFRGGGPGLIVRQRG